MMVHQTDSELCEALLGANLKNNGEGRHSVERIMVLIPVKLVGVVRVPPALFSKSVKYMFVQRLVTRARSSCKSSHT
jgi:hypothetical protein